MTFEPDHGALSAAAPSWWRRTWERVRSARPGLSKTAAPPSGKRRLWRWAAWAILAAVVLYYPVGALIVENIDDDAQFAPRNVAPGESRAVRGWVSFFEGADVQGELKRLGGVAFP